MVSAWERSRRPKVAVMREAIHNRAPRIALSVEDVQHELGISKSTVYARIAEGVLDARKHGDRTLIIADGVRSLRGTPGHDEGEEA